MNKPLALAFGLSLVITGSWAEEENQANHSENELDEVFVTGGKEEIQTTPGSAHLVDKAELEKFEYTDIQRVLGAVPGVYIRTEDGFGLRPNIGMRGAAAERSQKISIMEDGILIGPAPYSAPAAYYFPNVARMENVEVFKGPVSIKYGPNTVGGALNLITTSIPNEFNGNIDITGGSHQFYKLNANVGDSYEQFGWLAEALTFGSEGFKELDGGGDTGFQRNDFNLKFRYTSPASSKYYQRVDVKLGYADEVSDETYLGLTDADFDATPYRRYAASQLDEMVTDHQQLHVTHVIELTSSLALTTRVYQNNFYRSWNKFDDFRGAGVFDVLANPTGANEVYYNLLTGTANSDGSDEQKINVTDNEREYVSRGVEFSGNYELMHKGWIHELEAGIRLHNDYVERNHTLQIYEMQNGNLVSDGSARSTSLKSKGETQALAGYLKDKIFYEDWVFTAGLRGEVIRNEYTNRLSNNSNSDKSFVLIPGAGVFYQYTDAVGLFAGVFKGFAPNSPGATDEADPEESINTEYGVRYQQGNFNAELLGFYNRYENLLGRCRASDSGCVVDEEFNGGEVDILGAEIVGRYVKQLGDWKVPLALTYTYTDTAFRSSFSSSFSQWGEVEKGDKLPYIPLHQLRLELGLKKADWNFVAAAKYTGEMREVASQGDINDVAHTPGYTVVDAAAGYQWTKALQLQLAVDNVFDEVSIVSRRPFGARPNKPRSMMATVKYGF